VVGRPTIPTQVRRQFWQGVRSGLPVPKAAAAAGVATRTASQWHRQAGGVNPYPTQPVSGRYLSFEEREDIALGLAAGRSQAEIARGMGRSASTVSREIKRNSVSGKSYQSRSGRRYRAGFAQSNADAHARRPKRSKVAGSKGLRKEVQSGLTKHWSPQQICARLVIDFPDDQVMRISPETIYKSLYVQGRGGLNRELVKHLRTGRLARKAHRKTDERRGRIVDMVNISARPAEVADRAVPGHWEGDLIVGANCASAIGTLVERTTRFTLLAHLPGAHGATEVRQSVAAQISDLPAHLARSLTWDQGKEMAQHAQFSVDTGVAVFFADPHSPWQRGTNENTNGLLRQYFPKGTSLKPYSAAYLTAVAQELNGRPRKALGWATPAEAFAKLLSKPDANAGVIATTP
jgi:IS30 family transposase